MSDELTAAELELGKALICLALELPSSVHMDFMAIFARAEAAKNTQLAAANTENEQIREQAKTARADALREVETLVMAKASLPPTAPHLTNDCCRISRHTGWVRGMSEIIEAIRHLVAEKKDDE